MKIVVCVRQGRDGELNPFDASAYETALQIPGAEILLLSMGPAPVRAMLLQLTRLGARRALLLSDRSFAGSDTLATAYVLSLAVRELAPDLVICGRQTMEGDTAQTGPMLSVLLNYSLITNVMDVSATVPALSCRTREEGDRTAAYPALITVERKHILRLPSIRSECGTVEVRTAKDLGADLSRCGLAGSPTRVLETFAHETGRRRCRFLSPDQLLWAIEKGKQKERKRTPSAGSAERLSDICIIGSGPRPFAESVSNHITVLPPGNANQLARQILTLDPPAVLWGSDPRSKRLAAQTAAMLGVGLCADCTRLEVMHGELMMYRPAQSGSIIAKIKSMIRPAMATVRTAEPDGASVILGCGYGVRAVLEQAQSFAGRIGAELAATRKMVIQGCMPYELQVGMTGKTVCPAVYIAAGASGAVHHIVGMQGAGTVIAINPDPNAPIFDYADYGIIGNFETVLKATTF